MEHRLDHELDRKDEREEEPCLECGGIGYTMMSPRYGERVEKFDCTACNGTGFKQPEACVCTDGYIEVRHRHGIKHGGRYKFSAWSKPERRECSFCNGTGQEESDDESIPF